MSVSQIFTTVMRMLNVQICLDPSTAPVQMDILEMERIVPVRNNQLLFRILFNIIHLLFLLICLACIKHLDTNFLLSSDIDECVTDIHDCDENAECFNIFGSYNCTCSNGFTGDGNTCTGK